MNKNLALLVGFAFAGLLCRGQDAPATSELVDPEKTKVIRQIAGTLANSRKRLVDLTLSRITGPLRANSNYPEGYVTELTQKLRERVDQLDLVPLEAPAYAKRFSVEELIQILAFYQSPTGTKYLAVQPEVSTEIQQSIWKWVQQARSDIDKEIVAEHPEYSAPIAQAQQKQADASGAFSVGGNVSAPQLITKTDPSYSDEARAAKISGSVTLSLVVSKDGIPTNVRVVKSLGLGLDEKAIEAVQKWRFKPALKDGVAVATQAVVSVNFKLLQPPPKRP